MKYVVHTDGGARGNPGPAAVGVVIEEVGATGSPTTHPGRGSTGEIVGFGKRIGETTNNVAEYTAVIEALTYFVQSLSSDASIESIEFFLDSTLVVNQLNGLFKVKELHLRELLMRIRILEQKVGGHITYAAVRREQNVRADYFVNQALDA